MKNPYRIYIIDIFQYSVQWRDIITKEDVNIYENIFLKTHLRSNNIW